MNQEPDIIRPDQPSSALSEADIKRAALVLLRTHYRFRVKADNPELSTDLRGSGGIVADGAYSFQKEDKTRFWATLEATSLETKGEVSYRLQRHLLLWDGITVGFLITALAFEGSHIAHYYLVKRAGVVDTVVYLLFSILIFAFLYILIFHFLRRYRYILAVEQFKQYHADEQWIAIGEDVFPNSEDKRLRELRNQCIYNGFGLIVVNRSKKAHFLLTPARRDVFGHRRKAVQFFTENEVIKMLQKGGSTLKSWWKKFGKGLPIEITPLDLNMRSIFFRFNRSVHNQVLLCSFSLLVIAIVFYQELAQRPYRSLSQERYSQEVLARQSLSNREPDYFVIDTLFLRPYNRQVMPYLLLLQTEQALAQQQGKQAKPLMEVVVDAQVIYDCERLYNFRSRKFIIQESVYPDFEQASRRVYFLSAMGFSANSLWMGCFSPRNKQYIVFFDTWYDSEKEAKEKAIFFDKLLKEKNLSSNLAIKTLMPNQR